MTMLNSVTMTRSRRSNAGSRMARLLNEEEEDEFYTSAYGGFVEVCQLFSNVFLKKSFVVSTDNLAFEIT